MDTLRNILSSVLLLEQKFSEREFYCESCSEDFLQWRRELQAASRGCWVNKSWIHREFLMCRKKLLGCSHWRAKRTSSQLGVLAWELLMKPIGG